MTIRFSDRVKELGLPLGEIIVIGSGVMGELGIRRADDVDLVVTESMFESLAGRTGWQKTEKDGFPVYINAELNVEVWLDWVAPRDGRVDFTGLLPDTVVLHGVRFMTIDYILAWNRWCGRDKDVRDVALIDEYKRTTI